MGIKMEILTLLKANIRHKKGSFISIVLLLIIISMSLTAILSVRENCIRSIENAHNQVNSGDLEIWIISSKLTDELLNSVENNPMVKSTLKYQSVLSEKAEVNGNTGGNGWYLLKLQDKYKLFNSELSAYEDETPALKRGEIYITQGIMSNLGCNVGDIIKLFVLDEEYEFKIKGIVVEPMVGAFTIGWKRLFISDEDFDKLYADAKKNETEERTADQVILQIYKADDCKLSDAQFKRQLNLDTGIVDNSIGSLTRDLSIYYTNLFPKIVLSILMVFIGLLLAIVLIVMGHSISTGIEMDYVNLGVLKSQGFTKGKIRTVLVLQYLLAELTGAVAGMILAVPLIKFLGNVFQPITAIPAERNILFIKSMLIIIAILVISGLFIFIITRKVGRISPVRAISGGNSEIYFDSRIKLPIFRKGLSASLALRQFTSSKKRYVGTIVIVSILVFFMMTITVLGNVINSKSAVESMGAIYTECGVSFKEKPDDNLIKEIEETIESFSAIRKKYYSITEYFSINGEDYLCQIYKNPDAFGTFLLKGRAPLYNNEIVITEILADNLGLKIGDKVTVSYNDRKSEFMVSGFFQSMNDAGMTFAMSLEGAERLGVDSIVYAGYSLHEPSKAEEIADALNEGFADNIEAEVAAGASIMDGPYVVAINAMKAVIYAFSIIFALVVVSMVCKKTFMQEKKDIGIFKSLGFTSINLRFQFAVRFLIVALAGSVCGTVLCVLFSGRLLSKILWDIGITNFVVDYTAFTFIAPISLICGCFFLFAFLVTGKIRRIEVRELVTE